MGDRAVVLGAGSIGLSLAAALADAGHPVTLAEPDAGRRGEAPAALDAQRAAMALAGVARNGGGRVTVAPDPGDALAGAALVIECGPESLDVKRAIFEGLLARARRARCWPPPPRRSRCRASCPTR